MTAQERVEFVLRHQWADKEARMNALHLVKVLVAERQQAIDERDAERKRRTEVEAELIRLRHRRRFGVGL